LFKFSLQVLSVAEPQMLMGRFRLPAL